MLSRARALEGTRIGSRLARTLLALAVGIVTTLPVRPATRPVATQVHAPSGAILAAARATEPEALLRLLINEERAGSARTLKMHGKLIRIARRHSARMASAGGIYHNPNLARDAGRIRWSILGENVGVGNSIETLHQAFMDSPPHRDNLMRSQFRRVGVGVIVRGGRLWVTVVFLG